MKRIEKNVTRLSAGTRTNTLEHSITSIFLHCYRIYVPLPVYCVRFGASMTKLL